MREKYLMNSNTNSEIKKFEEILQEIHLLNVELHQDVDNRNYELEYV